MRVKTNWKNGMVILIVSFISLLGGCGTDKLTITGGAIPKYALCLEAGKEEMVAIPIISNRQIKEVTLEGVVTTEEQQIDFSMGEFAPDSVVEYKGKFIYYLPIMMTYPEKNPALNLSVKGLKFKIDSQDVLYEVDDFYICSIEYLEEKYGCTDSKRDMLINGNITGIYSDMPNKDYKAEWELIVSQKVSLEKYMILNDILNIEGLNINEKNVDASCINQRYDENETIAMEYYFSYGSSASEQNIIRASQIVIFSQENLEKRIFVYSPGVYIYKDFKNQGAIKNYIDNH